MNQRYCSYAGRASALPAFLILLFVLLYGSCYAESDVAVCILDSGCNNGHELGKNFVSDSLHDDIGHGTQICSLVREIAPDADVIMLKCFDSSSTVNEEAIISALYTAVNEYHADVINMSWTLADESEALRDAVLYAHEQGAILVSCTGNLNLTTDPGAITYPAAWDEVIGVEGVDLNEDGEPQTSLWSLYGEAVDFCARGDSGDEKGSSYAAARVSGMIADTLQNGIAPSQIPEYFAVLAQDMGTPEFDDRFGWGYLETP